MAGEKAKDFKGTFKKLAAYLSKYKIGLFFVVIFAIGSAAFSIVCLLYTSPSGDFYPGNEKKVDKPSARLYNIGRDT